MTAYAPQEASTRSGFSLDTLRYYERIGLLDDVERTSAGRRVYHDRHLEWLGILHCLRRSGMPIQDMRRYAELTRIDGTEEERLAILEGHRKAVLANMDQLRTALEVVEGKIEHYRAQRR